MSLKKIEPYFSIAFLTFVVLMPVSQASFAGTTRVGTVDLEEVDPYPSGVCTSEDGKMYDMEDLRHLSNESIKMRVNDSEFILTVDSELLLIVQVGNEDNGELIFNLQNYASEDERLDVLVNFAELDHEDFVYWRESYVRRTYLHGLFKFDGDDLVPVCSGSGGVTIIRW